MSRDTAKFERLMDRAVLGLMLFAETKREADIHERLAGAVHTSKHTIADWLKASRPRLPKQPDLENLVHYVVRQDGMEKILDRSWLEEVFRCDSDYYLPQRLIEDLFPNELEEKPLPPPLPQIGCFVGREAESETLYDQLRRERVTLISGMTGIGKSTLARQIAGRWRNEFDLPSRIFWHEFHANEADDVLEKLAAFLAFHGKSQVYNQIRYSIRHDQKINRRDLLRQLVLEVTRGRYLLCLDNIHTICNLPDTDYFLGLLLDRLSHKTFSMVIVGQQMPRILTERRFEKYQIMPLQGLSLEDTVRLLKPSGITDEHLIRQLHRATDGNGELLTLLMGWLNPNHVVEGLLGELSNVATINEFVLHKIHHGLSDLQNRIMQVVAIFMGHPGSRQAIEAILGNLNIVEDVRQLQDRHLLRELVTEDGRLTERYTMHDIVRGFYYNALNCEERKLLHRRAGEFYDGLGDTLHALMHFEQAGDEQRVTELITMGAWPLICQGHLARVEQVLLSLTGPIQAHLSEEQIVATKRALSLVYRTKGNYALAAHHLKAALQRVRTALERAEILYDMGKNCEERGGSF